MEVVETKLSYALPHFNVCSSTLISQEAKNYRNVVAHYVHMDSVKLFEMAWTVFKCTVSKNIFSLEEHT